MFLNYVLMMTIYAWNYHFSMMTSSARSSQTAHMFCWTRVYYDSWTNWMMMLSTTIWLVKRLKTISLYSYNLSNTTSNHFHLHPIRISEDYDIPDGTAIGSLCIRLSDSLHSIRFDDIRHNLNLGIPVNGK